MLGFTLGPLSWLRRLMLVNKLASLFYLLFFEISSKFVILLVILSEGKLSLCDM